MTSVAMHIDGGLLEITVVGCKNLRDTEWIFKQDPYIVIQYYDAKFRTRTHTDGGRNPNFNQKFLVPLKEGLKRIDVTVWNSNTLQADNQIGSCSVPLESAFLSGHDDITLKLQTTDGRYAGDVRLVLHMDRKNRPTIPPPHKQEPIQYLSQVQYSSPSIVPQNGTANSLYPPYYDDPLCLQSIPYPPPSPSTQSYPSYSYYPPPPPSTQSYPPQSYYPPPPPSTPHTYYPPLNYVYNPQLYPPIYQQ